MKRYPLKDMKEILNIALRNKEMNEIIESHIGNYTQFQILKYLIENDEMEVHQKDFESVLQIRKSTISGILDTMEKNNIITRLSRDDDGRGKIVKLSSCIESCKKDMLMAMENVEAKIVEGISEKDLDTFYRVLGKMRENIEKGRN